MLNSIQITSTKIFIIVFLVFLNTAPSFAQLYGTPVSNMGNISVPSPNKKWFVSVEINKDKLPILTIQMEPEGGSKELMGVSRSGWVLWSPDSKSFSFTDAAFANHYFVHLCSVEPAGTRCRDISSEIEVRVRTSLSGKTEIDKLYVKALKWRSPTSLVVGVCVVQSLKIGSGQTSSPASSSFRAFLVNAGTGHITKELSERQARLELGANLDQLEW